MADTGNADGPDVDPQVEGYIEDGLYNAHSVAFGYGPPADERLEEEQSLPRKIDAIAHAPYEVNPRLVDGAVTYAWATRGRDDDPMGQVRSDLDDALAQRWGITASQEHDQLMVASPIYAEQDKQLTRGRNHLDGDGVAVDVSFQPSPGAAVERREPAATDAASHDRGISRS